MPPLPPLPMIATMVATPAKDTPDQRQLTAEERHAEGLQQGRQAAGEQRSGNQQADVAGREAGGLAEDQGTATIPPYMVSTCCRP